MKQYAANIKLIAASTYKKLDSNRNKLALAIAFAGLALALIIGAGYRGQVLKEKFNYQIGNLAWVLSMASTYTKAPGLYNSTESGNIIKNPEEYVYTSNANPRSARSSVTSDIGYPLLVRFMLNDNMKGVESMAWHIARYQMMADLLVIVVLFFAGYRTLGATCGILAALLYAVFRIPMVQMSFVEYYYWPVPLSALCLLGLTFIFGDRKKESGTSRKTLFTFFGFGFLIGFATYMRLIFFNLSFAFLPLIFLRELFLKKSSAPQSFRALWIPSIRKTAVLFGAILVGQMIFTLPLFLYNMKHHHKFVLSDRQFWHLPLQGIGLYKNDWGIKDSGDVSINEWAMERGAPSYMGQPPDVIDKAEIWHRNKYFEMVRENPQFFWNNFSTNFRNGLTVAETDFRFYGFFGTDSKMYKWLADIFPWMVLSAAAIIALMLRNRLWVVLAAMLQGLYLLLIVVTWFANYPNFISGYVPVFVFLLAISLAVYLKIMLAFLEALFKCWMSGNFAPKNIRDEFIFLFATPEKVNP